MPYQRSLLAGSSFFVKNYNLKSGIKHFSIFLQILSFLEIGVVFLYSNEETAENTYFQKANSLK